MAILRYTLALPSQSLKQCRFVCLRRFWCGGGGCPLCCSVSNPEAQGAVGRHRSGRHTTQGRPPEDASTGEAGLAATPHDDNGLPLPPASMGGPTAEGRTRPGPQWESRAPRPKSPAELLPPKKQAWG